MTSVEAFKSDHAEVVSFASDAINDGLDFFMLKIETCSEKNLRINNNVGT